MVAIERLIPSLHNIEILCDALSDISTNAQKKQVQTELSSENLHYSHKVENPRNNMPTQKGMYMILVQQVKSK